MKEIFGDKIFVLKDICDNLPNLSDLMNKIILKGKLAERYELEHFKIYSNTKDTEKNNNYEIVDSKEITLHENKEKHKKPGHIQGNLIELIGMAGLKNKETLNYH